MEETNEMSVKTIEMKTGNCSMEILTHTRRKCIATEQNQWIQVVK